MKKLITLLVGFIMAIALQAQTSGTTYTLPTNTTIYTAFNNTHTTKYSEEVLKDSIGGTATKYWVFAINKPQLYYFQLMLEYDTILTKHRVLGNHVTVRTSGSIDGIYYTTIDTVLFHPTTMWLPPAQILTSIPAGCSLKDISTGVLWRYIKVTATGGDANKCSIISKLAIKVGIRY